MVVTTGKGETCKNKQLFFYHLTTTLLPFPLSFPMTNGRLKPELFRDDLTLPERAYIDHLISSNYIGEDGRVLLFATSGILESRAPIFERIRHHEAEAREEIRYQKNRYARELRRYTQRPEELEWEIDLHRDIHPTLSRDELANTVVKGLRIRIECLDELQDNLELEQHWHLAVDPSRIYEHLKTRGWLVVNLDPKNYDVLANEVHRVYAIGDDYRKYKEDKIKTFLGQKLVL
jgi:hypothetical protein